MQFSNQNCCKNNKFGVLLQTLFAILFNKKELIAFLLFLSIKYFLCSPLVIIEIF